MGAYARAWQVPAGETARFQLDRAVTANFGDHAELIGMELPAEAKPGDTVKLRLAFENRQVFDQLYKVFVHLRGPANDVVAQADRVSCDTTLNEADWRPGDILVDDYELSYSSRDTARRLSGGDWVVSRRNRRALAGGRGGC